MDAYLEAYGEFKHLMLALLYAPPPSSSSSPGGPSPVAAEWALSAREELAGQLAGALRLACPRAQSEPRLLRLLQYVLTTRRSWREMLRRGAGFGEYEESRAGTHGGSGEEEEAQIADSLLPPGQPREPPPLPRENAPGSFAEADVQALVLALGDTRQASVEALKVFGARLSFGLERIFP